ncbi:unnamed protein product [Trichobilharzia regenti]|nr:unnamed protein product [Trichobilharzia regenti]
MTNYFSLKQKTLKWKSKSSEILKQNLIKQLKTSSHRNCKSSLCLNKSLQSSSRNVSIRHSKCIESNANNEMIQSTDFNSDHDTMSNHSYHCKSPSSSSPSQSSSLPDDASELEQRRWKMQVKTYLNAAAQAEQLIRSKYSPTTQPRTTTTPPTTTTTITEQFKSWLAGVNASSNAKLRNRNKQDKQSKKYIKENTNNNEEILIDVSDGTKFPNMKQSKQHSHINNVWDSQFQASTNNNNVDTEEGEDGDDDDDEEASDIKANKDGDDSNEPLNFWDDYQVSFIFW